MIAHRGDGTLTMEIDRGAHVELPDATRATADSSTGRERMLQAQRAMHDASDPFLG